MSVDINKKAFFSIFTFNSSTPETKTCFFRPNQSVTIGPNFLASLWRAIKMILSSLKIWCRLPIIGHGKGPKTHTKAWKLKVIFCFFVSYPEPHFASFLFWPGKTRQNKTKWKAKQSSKTCLMLITQCKARPPSGSFWVSK